MPIDVKLLHDGMGILYHCHGTVTGKDFIEANKRILIMKESLKQVRYGLIDETEVENIHMTESEMVTVTAQNRKIASLVPSGAIVAVISENDFDMGLARVWESFIEYTGWETMTFRTRWQAESWIKEKVKANCGIDLMF
jgi:hypothetical protein